MTNPTESTVLTTYLADQVERGALTAARANVLKVRGERVLVVRGKLPRDVRNALNAAVKAGDLAHLRRDGAAPEIYYHPDWRHLALEARAAAVNVTIRALRAVCS